LKTESDMQRHPIDDIGLGVQRVTIAQHHRARVRGLSRLPNLKAAGETLQRKQSLGGEENSIARETLEKSTIAEMRGLAKRIGIHEP